MEKLIEFLKNTQPKAIRYAEALAIAGMVDGAEFYTGLESLGYYYVGGADAFFLKED